MAAILKAIFQKPVRCSTEVLEITTGIAGIYKPFLCFVYQLINRYFFFFLLPTGTNTDCRRGINCNKTTIKGGKSHRRILAEMALLCYDLLEMSDICVSSKAGWSTSVLAR